MYFHTCWDNFLGGGIYPSYVHILHLWSISRIISYCNDPTYWDRQVWANSVDPDQMASSCIPQPEIPWTRLVLGNVVLHGEQYDDSFAWRQMSVWRHNESFDIMSSGFNLIFRQTLRHQRLR